MTLSCTISCKWSVYCRASSLHLTSVATSWVSSIGSETIISQGSLSKPSAAWPAVGGLMALFDWSESRWVPSPTYTYELSLSWFLQGAFGGTESLWEGKYMILLSRYSRSHKERVLILGEFDRRKLEWQSVPLKVETKATVRIYSYILNSKAILAPQYQAHRLQFCSNTCEGIGSIVYKKRSPSL